MTAAPGTYTDLIRKDGSCIVPGDIAGELLAAAVRDLTARARRDGLLISARAAYVLQALHEAAVRHDEQANVPTHKHGQPDDRPGTGVGTDPATASTVGGRVTAAQAAGLLGCGTSYVRRLCRTGRLAGEKAGPVWLVDQASLDRYRYHRRTP